MKISAQRPDGKSRTNSAPLVQTISEPGRRDAVENGDKPYASDLDSRNRDEGPVAIANGQDEDEVAGVVGTLKHFQPFRNHEVGILIELQGIVETENGLHCSFPNRYQTSTSR